MPGVVPLDAAAARGREVYVGEGCSYCHTQQVRPLAQDRVWGRPSRAGDYAYSTPQLLGSERTGPDLSNIGARQPSDGLAVDSSLRAARARARSIMPAYPWLFVAKDHADPGDVVVSVPPEYAPPGKVVVATRDEQDLVAYLTSLKQPALRRVAGAVNGMQMAPPPGGDSLGTIVVIVGAIATLLRVRRWRSARRCGPAKTAPDHPKNLIFRDDR